MHLQFHELSKLILNVNDDQSMEIDPYMSMKNDQNL
jgi:hypothetical protein